MLVGRTARSAVTVIVVLCAAVGVICLRGLGNHNKSLDQGISSFHSFPPKQAIHIDRVITATIMNRLGKHAAVVLSATAAAVLAQTSTTTTSSSTTACPTVLSPSYSAPVVGPGWTAQLIARNLSSPRSILFDTDGALLVVQQGVGILQVRFDDHGGTCLVVNSMATAVENKDVSAPCLLRLCREGETGLTEMSSSTTLFNCPRTGTRCMRLRRTRYTVGRILRRMDQLENGRRLLLI